MQQLSTSTSKLRGASFQFARLGTDFGRYEAPAGARIRSSAWLIFSGTLGNDILPGTPDDDYILGDDGDDTIDSGDGNDFVEGWNGNDTISTGAGDDGAAGGEGDDIIYGGAGSDNLFGELSNETRDGISVNGWLNGGDGLGHGGEDVIDGGAGADTLVGGMGADTIIGGGGDDQFVYASAAESSGASFDTISGANFNHHDVFDLPSAVTSYATLTGGNLDASSFDADLGGVMSTILSPGRAVLFTATTGSFAGQNFLVVDADGVAGYMARADFVFLIQGSNVNQIGLDDFI